MKYSIVLKLLILLALLASLTSLASQIGLSAHFWQRDILHSIRFLGGLTAILSLSAIVSYVIWWHCRQKAINARMGSVGRVYSLAPQTSLPPVPCDFWRRVHSLHPQRKLLAAHLPAEHIGFELTGASSISLLTLCTPPDPDPSHALLAEVGAEWPGTEIRRVVASPLDIDLVDEGEIFTDPAIKAVLDHRGTMVWQTFRLQKGHLHPLHKNKSDNRWTRSGDDSLSSLLAAVDAAREGVTIGVQILARPAPPDIIRAWERQANRLRSRLFKDRIKSIAGPNGRRYSIPQPGPRNPDQLRESLTQITSRLEDAHALYEICLRVWAASASLPAATAELDRLSTAVMGATRGAQNALVPDKRGQGAGVIAGRHFPVQGGFILTARELGGLIHLPDKDTLVAFPRLHRAGATPLPPERRIIVESGRTAGKRIYGSHTREIGQRALVGHPLIEARTHTFIFGATGSGKSTLATHLILQDWLGGAGTLVLDPHGQLANEILANVPPDREGDVVILDVGSEQPFRFNLCQVGAAAGKGGAPEATTLVTTVEYILEAIAVSENASWDLNINMRDILHHAILLALDVLGDGASMVTVQRLLEDDKWRKTLIKRASFAAKPAIDYWENAYARMNVVDRNRAMNAAKTRVRSFIKSPIIRRALGMAGITFDLTAALNDGKLILAPMPADMGLAGRRLWGALLVREFLTTLMARKPGTGRPASLFIDELAAAVGTMAPYVKKIITELRKYGAAGTFLAQSFAPLPPELQTILKSQCATQVIFRGAADDAALAARVLGEPVSAGDIQNLRPYHAYARLAVTGSQSAPCLLRMAPPPRPDWPRPETTQAFKSQPPAEWAPLLPEAPQVSSLSSRQIAQVPIAELLAYIEQRLAVDEKKVIDFLNQRTQEEMAALREMKQAYNQWLHDELLTNPGLMPDPVERLKTLSHLEIGVPWWFSEVDYLQNTSDHMLNKNNGLRSKRGSVLKPTQADRKEEWEKWRNPGQTASL